MQNIAHRTGSRENTALSFASFCTVLSTPPLVLYSAYSTTSHAITITCSIIAMSGVHVHSLIPRPTMPQGRRSGKMTNLGLCSWNVIR